MYEGISIFDPSHIAVLKRGSKLLVMDRVTGRSVFIPEDWGPSLRLAVLDEDACPAGLQELRARVLDQLSAQGLGSRARRSDGDINTLILKLTNACNYACAYCYDYDSPAHATHLEASVALAAVQQALDLCPFGLRVIFHGGEPFLMFRRIERIVLAAERIAASRAKAIFFTGQTNLSLLTKESVAFSAEHQVLWSFSLDGPAPFNVLRVLRDGGETHVDFVHALERFPEFMRNSQVMATITSANCGDLLGLSRYFHSCGLRGWDWSLFQPIGRGRNNDYSPETQVLIRSWNELFDATAGGEFDGFVVSPILKYLRNFIDGPGTNMCMRKTCGAARELLSISPNGQIEACDCLDRRGAFANLGNVKKTSLATARASEKAQAIRSRDVELTKCKGCIWLAVCGGTCLARAPGLHEVDELECQLSLNAFDRISSDLADSDRLYRYFESCHGTSSIA